MKSASASSWINYPRRQSISSSLRHNATHSELHNWLPLEEEWEEAEALHELVHLGKEDCMEMKQHFLTSAVDTSLRSSSQILLIEAHRSVKASLKEIHEPPLNSDFCPFHSSRFISLSPPQCFQRKRLVIDDLLSDHHPPEDGRLILNIYLVNNNCHCVRMRWIQ